MTSLTSFISRLSLLCSCVAFALSLGCSYRTATVAPPELPQAPATSAMRIVVLPVENLSGRQAPLEAIRNSFIKEIRATGIYVMDDATLEEFMTRYRMRYTGGLDEFLAKAFRNDERIDAVLIISLELYLEIDMPKVALISRLVSTADLPSIIWMKSVAMAGNDSPGLLGLGLITDPMELRERAIRSLAASFHDFMQKEAWAPPKETAAPIKQAESLADETEVPKDATAAPIQQARATRFGPKAAFQAPFIEPGKIYSVAVVPFFNQELRKDAGDLLLLHFVEALVQQDNLRVIEPGLVRNSLLNARVIMNQGISLLDADFILNTFHADLVLSGKVIEYADGLSADTPPRVDFLVWGIQRLTKRVVWASESYNEGNDAVFVFDFGKVTTASRLASRMAAAVIKELSGGEEERREEPLPFDLRESPMHLVH